MEIKLIYLLFILINLSLNSYVYKPNEVISFLNELNLPKEDRKYIIGNITKILQKAYAFYEIAKNPPQPDFDPNYHIKVDIKKELEEIDIEKKTYFELWKDIRKVLGKLRDKHLLYLFSDFFLITANFKVLMPIKLELLKNGENPRIFGRKNDNQQYIQNFSNYENVIKIIEKNINIPIKLINNKNPFDFISEFNNNDCDYKSPHAKFPLKYNDFFQSEFLPFSVEDLNNLTVVYDNEDILPLEYLIISNRDIYNYTNNDIFLQLSKIDHNYKRYINQNLMNLNNIFEEIHIDGIKFNKNENNLKLSDIDDSIYDWDFCDWDYCYLDSFKCKVDNISNINVYYMNNLFAFDTSSFASVILQCAELFDNNTYPIILIDDSNAGGSVFLCQFLLESFSPLSTANIYFSVRKTDLLSNYLINNVNVYNINNNCTKMNFSELLETEKEIKINYGNNVNDTLSPPFLVYGGIRAYLDELKSILKNKRKPTDIMVLTDGASFSAASMFIKYLQYYGGGITVGYFGNPNKTNIPYDSSVSPSAILSGYDLSKESDEYKRFEDKYQISTQIPVFQTFFDPSNMSIPLEYLVTPVDEVVPLYEIYSENNYDKFIDIAKKIFEKYKKECNPNNKNLVLVTSECDKFFKNNYTHGGYQCGSDGKWSTKCVASYCDLGYIFDHVKGKCVIDYCSKVERIIDNSDNSDSNDNDKKFYAIIIISCALSVVIIIMTIVLICMTKKKNDLAYDDIAKISLVIQDKDDI